ncbi:MAG: hypothetical protein ACLU99_14805 [Alphaproteobacteria bacterium]
MVAITGGLPKSLTRGRKVYFRRVHKKQIAEIDDGTLVAKTGQMFRFIAMDVGFIIPDGKPGRLDVYLYPVVGFAQKRYYSQLTLSEVKVSV